MEPEKDMKDRMEGTYEGGITNLHPKMSNIKPKALNFLAGR